MPDTINLLEEPASPGWDNAMNSIGNWWNSVSGTNSANQFSAEEAEKNRAFQAYWANQQMYYNSAEAQKQRDYETYMSNTAYQRQVADMRAAGINPAMAGLGGGGASTPSGQSASMGTPNGSMANSASAGRGGLLGLVAAVVGPVLAKVVAGKMMLKANSATNAARATESMLHDARQVENAIKIANHEKSLDHRAYRKPASKSNDVDDYVEDISDEELNRILASIRDGSYRK